jgi:hypothetical protein
MRVLSELLRARFGGGFEKTKSREKDPNLSSNNPKSRLERADLNFSTSSTKTDFNEPSLFERTSMIRARSSAEI